LNAELTNEQIIENVATAYYQVFVQEENLKTVEAVMQYRKSKKCN
jgi:outer membrane protein TolC